MGVGVDLWGGHALIHIALGSVRPLHSPKKLDPGKLGGIHKTSHAKDSRQLEATRQKDQGQI